MTSNNTGSSSSSGNNDPWAWLGLLKWSLSYTEGKSEGDNGGGGNDNDGATTTTTNKMSDEDIAFLEAVMKDGIIDENDRMKVILKQVTEIMSEWKEKQQQQQESSSSSTVELEFDEEQVDQVQDLLQELRDIVEQIDYARAFCALGGLDFLLGCLSSLHHDNTGDSSSSSSSGAIPHVILELCSGILATVATNNPPVQAQLLEMGSIRILTDAYFSCDTIKDARLQARILQAMSATVRSHAVAEQVFCETAQAVPLLEHSLGVQAANTRGGENDATQQLPPLMLQQRGLFFLRALVTSDTSTPARIQRFAPCIATAIDRFVLGDAPDQGDKELFVQLREMTLAMIQQLLEQANTNHNGACPLALWSRKDPLVARGVQSVTTLRASLSSSNEDEYVNAQNQTELNQWESLLVLLARANPPTSSQPAATPTPMIAAAAPEATPPQ